MSVSNINSNDVPSVNQADGAKNEDQLKQYQDQYQQLLSQYGDASAAWSNTASDIKTDAGTSICTAIGNQLNETKKKLDAFQAAVNASESSEETLKTMAEACKASVSNVTAYIAMVPMTVADAADISALRKIWEGLSDADKTLLGSGFTQATEAQFSAFNAKIVASQKAIADGADASVIEKLQSEITELKTQLSALINGTTDGSIMSITDRIACLKLLEEAKGHKHLGDEVYATFKQQLLSTDASKQISAEDFQAQLNEIIIPSIQKAAQKDVEETKSASQRAAAMNKLLKNNVTLKVMLEKNNFLEFELDAKTEQAFQEKAEFNPQVKQLRDEGRWQTPEMTRQREVTQMQNEDERLREETAQMR